MSDVKSKFPFFTTNPDIIYFDNASTTQKPQVVIDAINDYFSKYCANAGRGIYTTANKVTRKIEEVREKVKTFINANLADEIVFTSGTTASLNTIAYSWGLHNLQDEDEVLVCFEDHDSNVLPWIFLKETLAVFGKKINVVPFKNTSAGDASTDDILSKVTVKTRIIALTHIHNVYGMETDVLELKKQLPDKILLSLDAAQSISHIPVNVQELGIDFLSFSGHKMFASTGIGVLWINKRIHNQIHPFLVGGGTEKKLPFLLEGGTHNISGIISLGSAIDFINEFGLDTVQQKMLDLSQYLLAQLKKLEKVEFLPGIAFSKCALGYGIVSFNISGISSNEVGFILNENNIYVRTGSHCTGDGNKINDSVRVSMHVYNTKEEIDKLLSIVKTIT